jgi:mRNA interferase MazF
VAAPAVGAVVLVRFPFSDLTDSKLRPAAVLANVGHGDFILCQITSSRYADATAIELLDRHFRRGTLRRESYARPGKLFTASGSLIVREVGELDVEIRRTIVQAIEALLRKGLPER